MGGGKRNSCVSSIGKWPIMLVRVECLGFQIQAAPCYTISQAKLREKSGSPSNQASDQPIPTIAVTAIKARSIGLQDQVERANPELGIQYSKTKRDTSCSLSYSTFHEVFSLTGLLA